MAGGRSTADSGVDDRLIRCVAFRKDLAGVLNAALPFVWNMEKREQGYRRRFQRSCDESMTTSASPATGVGVRSRPSCCRGHPVPILGFAVKPIELVRSKSAGGCS